FILAKRTVVLFSFVAILVHVLHLISLSAATEPWRVYDNDYRPFFWSIPATIGTIAVTLAFLRWPRFWPLLLLLIPFFLVSRNKIINQRLKECITSCANHSAFWVDHDFDGSTPLPNSTEFADFLVRFPDRPDPLVGR